MERPCIIDLTLIALAQLSQGVPLPEKAALQFCGLILSFGAGFVEMPAEFYRRIEDGVPPQQVCLRVSSFDEYIQFKERGIVAFATDRRGYSEILQNNGASLGNELTLILADGEPWPQIFAGGQTRIVGLDGVMRRDYQAIFSSIIKQYGAQVCFDAGDNEYLATAAALEFLYCGGRRVCTAFCGFGRHAATERLMAACGVMEGTDFDLKKLPELRKVFETMTQKTVPGHMPVAGRDIFVYESGIHADGIEKNPKNYEPFAPESIGANRFLAIGKHSGRAAVRQKLLEHGLAPGDCMITALGHAVREFSDKYGRGLADAEFLALYYQLQSGIEGD
jgi:hypothetical protein